MHRLRVGTMLEEEDIEIGRLIRDIIRMHNHNRARRAVLVRGWRIRRAVLWYRLGCRRPVEGGM